MKIVKRILIGILVVVVLLVGGVYFFLSSSMAQTEGRLALGILEAEVEVYRDEKGVPTVVAQSEGDLYKAQGFIQAQDRLFQMDLARRQASGRLSEVVGAAALENDKKFLVFSLRRAAEQSYEIYTEEGKKILEDYTAGVNAYIDYAVKNNKLPYEFFLLGYQPEPWTPVDSLTIGKYMAYDLGGHWSYQAFNNWVLNNLGLESFKEMNEPAISGDKDIEDIIGVNQKAALVIDERLAAIEVPHVDNGSNNWVLSGSKTKTKKPLLADDPHLGLNTPSIWYQMVLKSPEVHVSGVIFAGIPGIILGHNEDVAWGVTNYGPDVQDLYIEKQNPDNKYQYEYDGKYYDAEVVKYNIKIKGGEAVPFEVVYTKNGPVMDDLLKIQTEKDGEVELNGKQVFSMRWTALDATRELEAIVKINKAKDWESFEKGLEEFKAPPQNFVFADQKGNIAFKANGNLPIRKKGRAILPVPGYSSDYAWEGYVDFDKLPKIYNPDSGYIATANTNTTPDYPHYASNVWAQPYRKARIEEFLSERDDFTYEDMQALQMDIKNKYAEEFLNFMIEHTDKAEFEEGLFTLLNEWNLMDDKDYAAPLIFHTWMEKFRLIAFQDLMDAKVYKFMPHKEHYVDGLLRKALKGDKVALFESQGGLEVLLTKSLRGTIEELRAKYGDKMEAWEWGEGHKLAFRHPLTLSVKALAMFLNPKEIPVGGSRITVQAASPNAEGLVTNGASWRFVYDFADNIGRHIVGPGQSGHFMSPYYKNQVENWAKGVYHSKSLHEDLGGKKLILVP